MRLDELNADNSIKAKLFTSQTRSAPFGLGVAPRAFNFHDADGDIGVAIDGSIRLGILISRLGDNSDSAVAAVHGSEVSFGPRESYDDANVDFDLENDVVYQHIDPAIGASTHSHGTDIRGNIKIFYTLIINHGNLVGDGTVNAAHLDSGSAPLGNVATDTGRWHCLVCAPGRWRWRRGRRAEQGGVADCDWHRPHQRQPGRQRTRWPHHAVQCYQEGAHPNCWRGTFHRRRHCR